MSPLEAALSRTIAFKVSKPRKLPFYKTVTASKQRLFRELLKGNLRGCEQVVMIECLNIWFRNSPSSARYSLAMSATDMAKRIGWSVRQVKTVMQRLIERGFLNVISGGCGRGLVRRFSVGLSQILKALAPGILPADKGCNFASAYNKDLLIGRSYHWLAGVWGRSVGFTRRLALALNAVSGGTYRFGPAPSGNTGQRQANFSQTTGDVEAWV